MWSDQSAQTDTLKNLYETCRDCASHYCFATNHVHNEDLKTLFRTYAQQRARYAEELKSALERLDTSPDKSGVIADTVLQVWTVLKTAVTRGDDKAILAGCESAENASDQAYEKALNQNLPPEIRTLLRRQQAGIREGHDRIRALELALAGEPG
jgi:uncharacterized protein (TIGR02284 family)